MCLQVKYLWCAYWSQSDLVHSPPNAASFAASNHYCHDCCFQCSHHGIWGLGTDYDAQSCAFRFIGDGFDHRKIPGNFKMNTAACHFLCCLPAPQKRIGLKNCWNSSAWFNGMDPRGSTQAKYLAADGCRNYCCPCHLAHAEPPSSSREACGPKFTMTNRFSAYQRVAWPW